MTMTMTATRCMVKLLPLPSIRGVLQENRQRFVRCTSRRCASAVGAPWTSWKRHDLLCVSLKSPSVLPRRHFSSQPSAAAVSSSLGLAETLVNPHSESIQQLPEIDNALQHWDEAVAIEDLQRAVQVFEMMQAGGPLHQAALALLAECHQYHGNFRKASRTLHTLEQIVPESFVVNLALAKASWYQGDFEESMAHVGKVVDDDEIHESTLSRACALNAEGIVRLLFQPDVEDEGGHSVVDVLRIAAKTTEQDSSGSIPAALASACARGNLGIAIVTTRLGLNQPIPEPASLDQGLCAFRDGLNLLDQKVAAPQLPAQHAATADFIRSQLYCNMSWTLLQLEDELKLASEYSSTALSFAEKLQGKLSERDYNRALGRSLRLVAMCYARADSALTAEGLFQSAMDALSNSSKDPLSCLDLRDAHAGYAALLHQWDKRSRDAENQKNLSRDVTEALTEGWRDKSSLCSGLWFITPGSFTRDY